MNSNLEINNNPSQEASISLFKNSFFKEYEEELFNENKYI